MRTLFLATFLSAALLSAAALAQNTLPVFPCVGQPLADGSCPKSQDLPANFSPVIGVNDYYDVYVEAICVDQPDSWWKNKLVHVNVNVNVGAVSSNIPVYADRTGGQCRIGVANFPLITSVPANGKKLTISAQVFRSDENDGLKKVLDFISGQQKNTVLNTYATAAVPYVAAVGDIGSQVYGAFANHTEMWLNFKTMALSPRGDAASRFDLRDEYFVQYAGPDTPFDNSIFLSPSLDLMWAPNNPVRGGSTWIVYRIQKYTHRQDYPTRQWYSQWQELMQQAKFRQIDANGLQKRTTDVVAVLMADLDYTFGDKTYYQDLILKAQKEMSSYLNNPDATPPILDAAFRNSLVQPQLTGVNPDSLKIVTAINAKRPVFLRQSGKDQVITPILSLEKMYKELHKANIALAQKAPS